MPVLIKKQRLVFLCLIICMLTNCVQNESEIPLYQGTDLGVIFTNEEIRLRVWSPNASQVRLYLYEKGLGGNPVETIDFEKSDHGTWLVRLSNSHENKFYTIQVQQEGRWLDEKPDLYAHAAGANGQRGMLVDLSKTNPDGWENDERPPLNSLSETILYEVHVRDATIHPTSGVTNKGKYKGLTESANTTNKTGIAHMKALGVTHVHLLPVFDYNSIDETNPEGKYNWGYDPLNYNVPEGSYSTDPYDGRIRIKEFKEMVQAFHANGLRVVMDVVYNHTSQAEESGFSQIVPGYFYRFDSLGNFSDASACGNETASEEIMMRKFIVESVLFWAREYHIDGFRFDLMGIHDQETMNAVAAALKNLDPTIIVYGEGWTAGDSPLPEPDRALKKYTHKMSGVAAFSDDMRDGLKGNVFDHTDRGFVSGKPGTAESVKFGIVASTEHMDINYKKVNYSDEPWASEPLQTINYVSCHDNHTLYDKLKISCEECSEEDIQKMHKLANAIVLTSQGIPFLHAGVEFLRSKEGVENSFESPDSINAIVWSDKILHQDHVAFYENMIRLRKEHPGFRQESTSSIDNTLQFHETGNEQVIAYEINGAEVGDSWHKIIVVLNADQETFVMDLPEGEWLTAYTEADGFDPPNTTVKNLVDLEPVSVGIFYQSH